MTLPETADLVVIGTGLVESLLACAAAFHGKSVVVIDDKPHYGGAGATFNLSGFMEWYAKHAAAEEERCNLHQGADAQPPSQDPSAPSQLLKADRPPLDPSESISSSETAAGATAEQNPHRVASPEGKSSFETTEQVLPLHRDASEICGIRARVEPKCIPGGSRDYSIDIAHQALECTGPCVEAIRKAGLHLYIDFVPVSDAYVYSAADRALHPVPSGVAGVHAMSGLTAAEKRTMWLFMRQVERAATGAPVPLFQGRHFAADLQACKLPQSMHDAVLYGVLQCESAVDNDSELPGAAALAAILRYMSQAGAYVTGQAPFIEPCYGSGEVAQAAIRACCVHGGVAALGTSADALLSVVGEVTGVQLACGHVVRCKAVAVSAAVLPREDVGVRSSAGVDAQGMHRAGVHESSAAECSSGSGRRQRVTAWCASSQNVREESGAHGQRGTAAAGPHAPVDNAGDAPLDCGGCREWPDDVSGMSTRVDCGVAEGSKQSLMQTHNTALEHRKVARGIVLLDGPLLAMTTNCLVTIPPGACRNTHPVAVWQCHSSLHACPPGHVLLYLSTRCTGTPAADILQPCLSALLAASDTVHTDTGGAVDAAEAGAVREAVDAGGVGTVRAAVDAAEASAVGTAVAGTMQQAVDVAEAGAAPEAVGAAEVGDAHLGGAVGAAAAGTGGAVDTAEASTARGAGDNPAEGASGPCRGGAGCEDTTRSLRVPADNSRSGKNELLARSPEGLTDESGRAKDQHSHHGPASRVCVECYFTQSLHKGTLSKLPRGAVRCGVPSERVSMDSMAESASSLFSILFPGLEFLGKSGKWASNKEEEFARVDDSQSDKDPLEAALEALGIS